MNHEPQRLHCRRTLCPAGFTLIELLVVIAIIALLASILVPVVGSSINKARTTSSLANLRSIGQLIQVHVSDKLGEYPTVRSGAGSDIKQWPRKVWEHNFGSFGDSPGEVIEGMEKSAYTKTMWCPVQTREHGKEQHPYGRSSYGMNNFFEDPQAGGIVRYQGDPNVIGAEEPIVMAGKTMSDSSSAAFGTESQTDSSLPGDTSWNSMAYVYGSGGDMGLALYVDGHVATLTQEQGTELNDMISDRDALE